MADELKVGEQEQVERNTLLDPPPEMAKVADGEWVTYESYAAQAQRIAALEAAMPLYDQWKAVGTDLATAHAERDRLKEALKLARDLIDDCQMDEAITPEELRRAAELLRNYSAYLVNQRAVLDLSDRLKDAAAKLEALALLAKSE